MVKVIGSWEVQIYADVYKYKKGFPPSSSYKIIFIGDSF